MRAEEEKVVSIFRLATMDHLLGSIFPVDQSAAIAFTVQGLRTTTTGLLLDAYRFR